MRFYFFTVIATVFFLSHQVFSQSVSVDPSSGSAVISIPLYTLNYGSISIPINLNNTGRPLMVEETEGDAGLGWNLSCKSGVYREVRGLPDQVGKGWLQAGFASAVNAFNPTSDDNLSTYTDEASDFTFINGLGYGSDTEPDLYTVSAPGLYFQFVYDAAGVPRLLNYQDVKITTAPGLWGGFTVQNNRGKTYVFSTAEVITRKSVIFKTSVPVDMFTTDYNNYVFPAVFAGAWYLTSITDEIGNVVNYNYSPQPNSTSNSYRVRIKSSGTSDTLYYTTDNVVPQLLSTITAGNYSVNFSWGINLLHALQVSEPGLNDSFRFTFNYQSALSTSDYGFPFYYHELLVGINTTTPSCAPQVPYVIKYQGLKTSPDPLTTPTIIDNLWENLGSQDMWGFNNGISTNHNIPTIYFDPSQTDNRKFSFSALPGSSPTVLSGDVRDVKASKIGNGVIQEVIYPSGGYTKIIWECNKYVDNVSGLHLFGPGQRVKSLISDGGEAAFGRNAVGTPNSYHQIIKNYTYTKSDADTTSSGVMMYPPEYAFSTGSQIIRTIEDMSPGSYIRYTRIKESVSGQGSTVSTFSVPAMYPATTYASDWTASKSKIARNQTTHLTLTNVQNGYYTFPFAPNPNYDFSQSLLTSQAHYSETGALVRKSRFYYSRINPNLQSVYGLKFERLGAGGTSDCDCFHFSKYQIITGTGNVLTQSISSEISESNSSDSTLVKTFYHYNSDVVNNNFLKDSIRVVYGDGAVKRTKIRYVKDFATITSPTSGDVMASAIPLMIAANRQGELVEQFTTFTAPNGSLSYLGSSLQLYQNFGGKILPYQSYSLPQGKTLTPSSIITGTTQGFSYDHSNYLLSANMLDFDAAGNSVTVADNKKNIIGTHSALLYSLDPVAVFVNATARQTIYDGFEFVTGRNFTGTGLTYTTGWTGQRAANLAAGNVLSNNILDYNGIPYRVSCYVNGAAGAVITFQLLNGSTSVGSTTLTIPTASANQWIYLEGVLTTTSSSPATLKLQVSANANIVIDDILTLPQNATVNTQTFLPFKGVTSQTDDRGNSTTTTYDAWGRKINAFDRQRNMTELDEYQTKGKTSTYLSVGFTHPTIVAGQPFTATMLADGNCFNGLNYQWLIDQVVTGPNSTSITTTIPTTGAHTIQLIVTNPITGQTGSAIETDCVSPGNTPPTFSISNSAGGAPVTDVGPITWNVTGLSGGCGANNSGYWSMWQVSPDASNWTTIAVYQTTSLQTGSTPNSSILYKGAVPGYYMKVTITQTCATNNSPLCPATSLATNTSVTSNFQTVTSGKGN